MSEIDKLTELQKELGYEPGVISSVAMLGLVGEAGEVIGELHISLFNELAQTVVFDVMKSCSEAEVLKKLIRKGVHKMDFTLIEENKKAFDSELSDTFYYLNILAMNRGLSIDDLARMAREKVLRKRAEGGSSEDPAK